MRPILVMPLRCAEAITPATCLYVTSLLGRRWNSGWSGIAAAFLKRASSVGRSGTVSPFHSTVPSKSTSMVITVGGVSGGGGLPTGMLSFTACVWIGMVMISMISSTSITSINGVVLMSTITSGSPPPPLPTDMAMVVFPFLLALERAARRRLGNEADLEDRGALAGRDDATDRFVARVLVCADMDLGLRLDGRDRLELLEQSLRVAHVFHVPEDVAVLVHRDDDVLRLRLQGDVAFLRQVNRDLLHHHRDGDQEDDEQHQHHVDERRGVDGGHHLLVGVFRVLADCHGHGKSPSGPRRPGAARRERGCRSSAPCAGRPRRRAGIRAQP